MFVSEINTKKNLKVIGHAVDKTNKLEKTTKRLKDTFKKPDQFVFTHDQYDLMIKTIQQLNQNICSEILNYQNILKIDSKTQQKIQTFFNSQVQINAYPNFTYCEFSEEFHKLFNFFNQEILELKNFLLQKQNDDQFLQQRYEDVKITNNNLHRNLIDLQNVQKKVYQLQRNNTQQSKAKYLLERAVKGQKQIKQKLEEVIFEKEQELNSVEYSCELYTNDQIQRKENSSENIQLQKSLELQITQLLKNVNELKSKNKLQLQNFHKNQSHITTQKTNFENIKNEIENLQSQIENNRDIKNIKKDLKLDNFLNYQEKQIQSIKNQNQAYKIENIDQKNQKQNLQEIIDMLKNEKKNILTKIENTNRKNNTLKDQQKDLETQNEQIQQSFKNNAKNINWNESVILDKQQELKNQNQQFQNYLRQKNSNIQNQQFRFKVAYLELSSLKDQKIHYYNQQEESLKNMIKQEKEFSMDLNLKLKSYVYDPDIDMKTEQNLVQKKYQINNLKRKILVLQYDNKDSLKLLLEEEKEELKNQKEQNLKLFNDLKKKKKIQQQNNSIEQYFENQQLTNKFKLQTIKVCLAKKQKHIQNLRANLLTLKNQSFIKV